MSYSLHPGAENDVAGALDFYGERAGAAVAVRFNDIRILIVRHQHRKPGYAGGRR